MDPQPAFFKSNFVPTGRWHDYFRSNRNILEAVDWERGRGLSDDEKLRVAGSIREFQLGESSEGRHLNEFARVYSEKNGDPLYYETIKFFIREEQRHSQVLGRLMDREGIPRLQKCFVDSVFRRLRRYAGLEVSIAVLLMAEVVSLVYYRALRSATSSGPWKAACLELLRDEWVHLKFHGERLALIRRGYGPFRLFALGFFQAFLFTGTCLVVWQSHRRVLSTRHSLAAYWKAVWWIYGAVRLRSKRLSNPGKPSRGLIEEMKMLRSEII